jgi:hypothetical protein
MNTTLQVVMAALALTLILYLLLAELFGIAPI